MLKNTIFHRFFEKIDCLIDFSTKISDFHQFRMVRHWFFHDFHRKIIDVLEILLEISFLTIKCNHGWVPLQSASWELLPTSFAPNTLKSQVPTTHHQQQSDPKLTKAIHIWKKQTLRSVWTLVLRFPNYGNSDTCVWRHSPQNSHGKKTKTTFPSKSLPCNLCKPLSLL